jgi:predicted peptidase
MPTLPRFLTALLLAAWLAAPLMTRAAKPDAVQQAHTFTKRITRTVRADYLLFLPKGYGQKATKKWPLILFLHGSGERGSDLWLVAKHGPPKIVADKPDFPFIVVSPQCPAGQTWSDDLLLALLDEITGKYAVDKTRVYLTGLSMGGYGTWSLGIAHPDRFAAIAPICGGGDPVKILLAEGKQAEALKTLPVWAFHGAKDPVVNVSESERMVAALRQFGDADVKLTIYPDAQHDCWTVTYDNPKLYEWFLAHQRKSVKRGR